VAHDGGIVQRMPEHFATIHAGEQAVGVMNFGTVIIEFALGIFAEPKHARQGRQADGSDGRRFASTA